MKVNNFLTLYNVRARNKTALSPKDILDIVIDLINPISYISFDKKIELICKIIESSKSSEFPTAIRYRYFIVNMIAAYTNLEMTIEDFDLLSESKMLDIVLLTFDSEFKTCCELFDMCIYDIERR